MTVKELILKDKVIGLLGQVAGVAWHIQREDYDSAIAELNSMTKFLKDMLQDELMQKNIDLFVSMNSHLLRAIAKGAENEREIMKTWDILRNHEARFDRLDPKT